MTVTRFQRGLVLAVVSTALCGCTFGSGETTRTSSASRPDDATSTPVAPTLATPTTAGPTTTAAPTSTTSTSTTLAPTTTTTIPLVTQGAVIIVANASGIDGAAAKLSQELAAVGFQMAKPTNAAGNEEKLDVSKVYFLPAGADVATSIGRALGGVTVSQMPVPVWISGGPAALGEATVVIMLGKDLSEKQTMLSL